MSIRSLAMLLLVPAVACIASATLPSSASAADKFECAWKGESYGRQGKQRPQPPFLTGASRREIVALGSFECEHDSPFHVVNMKVCLQKLSFDKRGQIGFHDIECDDATFNGTQLGEQRKVPARQRCDGGRAKRNYRTNTRLTIFDRRPRTVTPVVSGRRVSRAVALRCRTVELD